MSRSTSRAVATAVSLVVMLAMAATAPASAAEVEVRIGERLDPVDVVVEVGTTVVWHNAHDTRHRIRAVSTPDALDSGNLEPGQRYAFRFDEVGTFAYVDDRDREDTAYHGTVRVVAAGGAGASDGTDGSGTGDAGTAGGSTGTGSGATTGEQPGPGSTSGPAAPTTAQVGMRGRVFGPTEVTIAAGGTVTWLNDDDRPHTVTAQDRSFDSGMMGEGARYQRRFDRAGRVAYVCLVHPDMTGTVVVVDESGTATPAPGTDAADGGTTSSPTGGSSTTGGTTAPPSGGGGSTSPSGDGDGGGAGGEGAGAPVASGGSSGGAASSVTVAMRDFSFAPGRVQVAVGGTVRFTNTGQALHTVTSRSGLFDSGFVAAGGAFRHRFPEVGSFGYVCTLHPEMVGTVVVVAASGAATSVLGSGASAGDRAGAGGSAAAADGAEMPARGSDPGADGSARDEGARGDGARQEASLVDDAFEPARLEVTTGTTVVWRNEGDAVHTVTAVDGSFDSGILKPGDSWELVVDEPGTYALRCLVHPDMTGELVVLANSANLEIGPAGGIVPEGAAGTPSRGPSTLALQLGMLGVFAVALAVFTVASGWVARVGEYRPRS